MDIKNIPMEYVGRDLVEYLEERFEEYKRDNIKNCVELFDSGATIPFVARYRKELTGGLDEIKLQEIRDAYVYFKELEERKRFIYSSIASQGKMTSVLYKKICDCNDKKELEDIYLPFKPKRKTKSQIAKEKGLEPLADLMLRLKEGKIEEVVKPFLDGEKGINTPLNAISGAMDIISEKFSENSEIRKFVRFVYLRDGVIVSKVKKDFQDRKTKFIDYYDFSEKISKIPSHRFFALKRGEKEKILTLDLKAEDKLILGITSKFFLGDEDLLFQKYLLKAINNGYRRLLLPSIKLDVMAELRKRADEEAIKVFEKNLRALLLQPPMGELVVMGIDPGYRTGCKIAVLNETGEFLDTKTIFPTPPFSRFEESEKILLELINKYKVEAIAIGNGTASVETRNFVKDVLKKNGFENLKVKVVNESGASVYSASDVAREEFPDLDLTVRGAISIGRRYQNPLAELVKIPPESIGVGQYQHDVSQARLKAKLKEVVEFCVNGVGVDLNTASYHLLSYVSGLSKGIAKKIVGYRSENGKFKNRMELLNVKGIGDRVFEQAAGFLKIYNGDRPLDSTMIHPESYHIVKEILEKLGVKLEEVLGNEKFWENVDLKSIVDEKWDKFTVEYIVDELKRGGKDIRKASESFEFDHSFTTIEDLKEGMILKGIITNITNFGVFVDVGVHQDGLVHISNLSDDFIKNPLDLYKVGDGVMVKVIEVDLELKRVKLSMKGL